MRRSADSAFAVTGLRRPLVAVVAAIATLASVLGLQAVAQAETTVATVAVSPPLQYLAPGGSAEYLVEVARTGGFADPVVLSASQGDGSALPAGLTATFTPATVTSGASAKLKIAAASSYAAGSLSLRVTGTSGSLVRTAGASASADIGLVEQCFVTIRGTVRSADPTAAPIAGVRVETTSSPVKFALTDAEGRYEITGVPLGSNNAPVIAAAVKASKNSPGLNRVGTYWPSTGAADLVCGRTPTIDFTLVQVVPGQLGGQVLEGELGTDGKTVQPIVPAVPVAGAKANITSVAQATTGADGRYVFKDSTTSQPGIQAGPGNATVDYSIRVDGPTTAPLRQRYWPSTVVAEGVAPDVSITAPDALLVRQCTASVSGRVVDSVTGDPVATAAVKVAATSGTDVVNTTTDTNGDFSVPAINFGVNNLSAPLDVTVTKSGFTTKKVTTSDATCGAALQAPVQFVKTVAPEPPGLAFGSVTGKAIDQDTGLPKAGVSVTSSPCPLPGSDECKAVVTAADGTFTLPKVPFQLPTAPGTTTTTSTTSTTVPPSASVSIVGAFEGFWSAVVSVNVQSGSTVTAPDLKMLLKRTASVRGVVTEVGTSGGSTEVIGPLAGATVEVADARCQAAAAEAPCTTPDDGSYSIVDVPLGNRNANASRNVVVAKSGYWSKITGFTAKAGVQSEVNVQLRKQCTASVRGVVRNASTQQPIANATVSVPSGTVSPATSPLSVKTDDAGIFQIDNLLLGAENSPKALSVSATAPGFYSNTTSVTLTTCGSVIGLNFGELPTVTSVAPDSGPATGGSQVVITGSNLEDVTSVRFGENTASFQKVPGTPAQPAASLVATSPAGAPGSQVDVIVRNVAGESTPSPTAKFSYDQETTTTTTSTTSTSTTSTTSTTTSTTTTSTTSTTSTTTVPPTSSTTSSTTSTTVPTSTTTSSTTTTTAPTSTTTSSTTSTTVPTSTTTSSTTTTTTAPTSTTTTTVPPTTAPGAPFVFSVSPPGGPTAGGGEVTINGERFTGATSVRFGDVPSPQVTVLSASQLRAKVPAGSAGTVAVTVESPAGSSVPRQGVTYTYLSPACAVPATLSAINGRVELQGGGFISVQLQRRPGLFGLGRYWSGTVSGQLPIAGTTRLERFTSLGITSDNVAALLPGTCGGVSLRLSTINTSVFPWSTGSLRAELVPSGAGTSVTAKVGRASVVGAQATGQLALG